jgi:hypothetical protein
MGPSWAQACQDEDVLSSLSALENTIASGRSYDSR